MRKNAAHAAATGLQAPRGAGEVADARHRTNCSIATSLQLGYPARYFVRMTTHGARPSAHGDPAAADGAGSVSAEIRAFWDEDAAIYDASPSHYPRRLQEQAAWAAALRRLLPEPPAKVLDVGAGTGFLSLLLAGQGYDVTAADLSPGMLARLRDKAAQRGLTIQTVEADALDPPAGDFAAVVERHLLWTLPDPEAALAAWHRVAPGGRLVLIEGTWSNQDSVSLEFWRAQARRLADRVRAAEPGHHGHYSDRVQRALPHGTGLSTAEVVALVQASPWGQPRLERLRDVEWAVIDGRGLLNELLGTHPRWAVLAGR
jgi:ubiquinone/menaquinone biosynthesis C-methylase UbiE